MAVQPIRLGASFLQGRQQRLAEDRLRQQMEQDAAREQYEASIRPIQQAQAQYGLRGQILGTVETPEDYRAALGEVSRLNLPTGDLPEDKRSTAWMTFKAPEPSQVAPSWLPGWAKPAPLLPASTALPAGEMSEGQIAPEDIPRVQRAAERGLPLAQQLQFSDRNIGRQLQTEQIASNREKYAEQGRFRESAEERARIAAGLAREKMGADIEVAGLNARLKTEELRTAGPGGKALEQAIKLLPETRERAATAVGSLGTITRMKSLLASGAGARPGMIMAGVGRLFGVQTEGMAIAEEYELLAKTLGGTMRMDVIGPGPVTDREQALLQAVSGGGATGIKAANSLLDFYAEKAAARARAYNDDVATLGEFDATIPRIYKPIKIPGAGGQASPTAPEGIPTVSSKTAYDALPPGAQYKAPDGRILTKKAR